MILDKARALVAPASFALPPRSAAAPGRLRFIRAALSPARPGKSGGSIRSTARRRPTAATAPKTAPWNSLARRPLVQAPRWLHTPAAVERSLLSTSSSGKRVYVADQLGEPARPARRHDHADERQLRRHRHRRLHAAGRQPEFRHGRGRAGTDAGVLDPVHPLDQQMGVQGIKVQSLFGTNNNKQALVTVTDQGAALPTSDIILENMQISSADSTDGWTQAAVGRAGRASVIGELGSPATAERQPNTTCVSMTGSHIYNVRFGATLMGTICFLAQRDRPFRRRRHRLWREQYLDHAQLHSRQLRHRRRQPRRRMQGHERAYSSGAFPITPSRTS